VKGKIMSKNAIIYARVSKEEQAEKGYSLESQIKGCRKYALDNRMNIVAEKKVNTRAALLIDPVSTSLNLCWPVKKRMQ
jgi:predicted site-specific integrase-resolvase